MNKFFVIIAGPVALSLSCAGSGSLGSYDAKRKQVVLQTSSDYRTAMPNASQRSEVKSVKKDLEPQTVAGSRDTKSMLNLASIYLAEGKLDQSESLVKRALRINLKSRQAKKIMAQIYMRRKNFDMATIILNGLGGDRSKDSEVLNMLALISIKEHRNSDAMAYFRKGLRNDPSNIAIRMNLGVLHVEYRQLSQASIQFERVLGLMPEHNDAKVHLAIIKASQGQFSEAEDIYDVILARKRDNPLALYNLAALETQRKNYSTATSLLKRFLDSKYAKYSGNDEVYALMEEISSRRRASSGASDDEIRSIAEQASEEQGGATLDADEQETNMKDSDTSMIDDDIKALEHQLK